MEWSSARSPTMINSQRLTHLVGQSAEKQIIHQKLRLLNLKTQSPNNCKTISWSAANGGLRDGGLRKSEDIWRKRPFPSVFWISQVLLAPSGKGRKRQKKGDFGRFRPISRKGGQTPLKPPFVTPPFAAAQISVLELEVWMSSQHKVQNQKSSIFLNFRPELFGGALKWGLWVLVLNCPQLPIQLSSFCDEKFSLAKGPKRPQMCRIEDNCARVAESGLKPPFESPRLNFP